mmetsp:Transcript_17253/g.51724  ORF Transcript_17253/g.51724 Transcript_17253/m.51724 type:complete len:253 (+) Transcript_17253:1455-2213(+)
MPEGAGPEAEDSAAGHRCPPRGAGRRRDAGGNSERARRASRALVRDGPLPERARVAGHLQVRRERRVLLAEELEQRRPRLRSRGARAAHRRGCDELRDGLSPQHLRQRLGRGRLADARVQARESPAGVRALQEGTRQPGGRQALEPGPGLQQEGLPSIPVPQLRRPHRVLGARHARGAHLLGAAAGRLRGQPRTARERPQVCVPGGGPAGAPEGGGEARGRQRPGPGGGEGRGQEEAGPSAVHSPEGAHHLA